MAAPHPSGYSYCPRCGGRLEARVVKAGEPPRPTCVACGFVFYPDPKTAAGIVALHRDRLLLLRRAIEPAYGAWVFPGGFVDRGEHPQEAAVREAREEAGVGVRVDGLLGVYSHPVGSPVVLIVYHGVVLEGEPQALDESLEVGLFEPAGVPWDRLAFSTTRLAVGDFVRRLGVTPPDTG